MSRAKNVSITAIAVCGPGLLAKMEITMKSKLLFLSAVTLSIASGAVLAADQPGGKSREQVRAELEARRSNPVSADGYRFVGGEVGYVQESMGRSARLGSGTAAGSLSREQVRQELQGSRANLVTSDGYRFIGGEVGYVYEGPQAMQRGLGSGTQSAGLTRDEVRQELERFRKNPVTSDGHRFIGGEQGYVPDALGR